MARPVASLHRRWGNGATDGRRPRRPGGSGRRRSGPNKAAPAPLRRALRCSAGAALDRRLNLLGRAAAGRTPNVIEETSNDSDCTSMVRYGDWIPQVLKSEELAFFGKALTRFLRRRRQRRAAGEPAEPGNARRDDHSVARLCLIDMGQSKAPSVRRRVKRRMESKPQTGCLRFDTCTARATRFSAGL